jgi:phosphoribosyl-ATP pyrophosphohydrolase/phosphoribosyl-AMP cyclohydrolase
MGPGELSDKDPSQRTDQRREPDGDTPAPPASRDPLQAEPAFASVSFGETGLIPAIAQDAATGEVLMQAYMNAEALARTLQTGQAHYYSRSRKRLWRKGEESGHVQRVREVRYDCDGDAVLVLVEQEGPACHTGNRSCFFRQLDPAGSRPSAAGAFSLPALYTLLLQRKADRPQGSYTGELFAKGPDRILKKIAEEAAEVLLAAKDSDRAQTLYELADLWFHTLVLMAQMEIPPDDVLAELRRRHGKRKPEYA